MDTVAHCVNLGVQKLKFSLSVILSISHIKILFFLVRISVAPSLVRAISHFNSCSVAVCTVQKCFFLPSCELWALFSSGCVPQKFAVLFSDGTGVHRIIICEP